MAAPAVRAVSIKDLVLGLRDDCHAPLLWREELLQCHLNEEARLAVYQCGSAGRDWVLQTAWDATLTLDLSTCTSANGQLLPMLSTARQTLQTRGPLSSHLVITQNEADIESLMVAAVQLAGVSQHVFSLDLNFLHLYGEDVLPPHASTATAFLAAAATALPNLRYLDVGSLTGVLPSPTLLPKLKELHARFHYQQDMTRTCHTLSAYLPQLESLHLEGIQEVGWHQCLFNTPAPTLTLLCCQGAVLDDTLLSLLLAYAPALETLEVVEVELPTARPGETWAVGQLRVWTQHADAEIFMGLPRRADGEPIDIEHSRGRTLSVGFQVAAAGISAEVLNSLRHWRIHAVSDVAVQPANGLPDFNQPTALRATLRQFANHQQLQPQQQFIPPGDETRWNLVIGSAAHPWDWTEATAQQLSKENASALPQARLCVGVPTVTDELLQLLMQHATAVSEIQTLDLQLQSDHSASVCPWDSIGFRTHGFGVGDATPTALLLLPQPASGPLMVHCQSLRTLLLSLSQEQIIAGHAAKLISDLPSRFKFDLGRAWAQRFLIEAPAALPETAQPAVLRASMEVARAVEGARWRVKLRGWTMTADVIAELAGLPQSRPDVLDLARCEWLPEADVCRALPATVPPCFTSWDLRYTEEAHVRAIIGGFAALPQQSEGRLVKLYGCDMPWLEAMQQYVQDTGLGGRVAVCDGYP